MKRKRMTPKKTSQNSFFIFDPFIVKMQSEKYFPIFTKEIQAKINESESESEIFA